MKISELMRKEFVRLGVEAQSKLDVIHQMTQLAKGHPHLADFPSFCRAIYEREGNGSTSIGNGVAIPHARTDQVKDMLLVVGRFANGVQFEENDPEPVRLVFLVGTPKRMMTEYLRLIGMLARCLREDGLREKLLSAPDPETFIKIFVECESRPLA